jgi:hypothetical protein
MDVQSASPIQIHVTELPNSGWLIELSTTNEPNDIPTPQLPPAPGRQ